MRYLDVLEAREGRSCGTRGRIDWPWRGNRRREATAASWAGKGISGDGRRGSNPTGAAEGTDEAMALSAAQGDRKTPSRGDQRRSRGPLL